MESKIVWKRGENIVETDPDGYLYAEGKRRTKILPEDLPEWFVYGYMYKRHGYVSTKSVKHLLYVPNYSVQNHLHKYDSLFISYNDPIEPTEEDNGFKWYKGYDHVLSGSLIVAYVRAAAKYSKYDVKAIFEEINRKQEFFYDRNPDERERAYKSNISKKFGRRLPYRGRDYILGGDGGKKPFFDDCFCVPVNYSDDQIRNACIKIYLELAHRDITEKVQTFSAQLGVTPPEIKLNGAKTSLGSLTKTLNFSWRLVMGNDAAIDYVVVSTLAHIIHPTRSPEYWSLVENILPDYKDRQDSLRILQERLKSEEWL